MRWRWPLVKRSRMDALQAYEHERRTELNSDLVRAITERNDWRNKYRAKFDEAERTKNDGLLLRAAVLDFTRPRDTPPPQDARVRTRHSHVSLGDNNVLGECMAIPKQDLAELRKLAE